jgi:hypothetical protein
VIERIADHGIPFVQQGLEQPGVGVETGRIEGRVFGAEKAGNPRFQLFVDGLGAADEAHRRHAEAVALERRPGRLDQRRMVRQAEIVVGAEVDDLAFADLDRRRLGGGDDPLGLVQAGVSESRTLAAQML